MNNESTIFWADIEHFGKTEIIFIMEKINRRKYVHLINEQI